MRGRSFTSGWLALLIALGIASAKDRTNEPKAAPAKPETRKFKFNVRGAPWEVVFQWLARETGKPLISQYKPPGTMSVHIPEGAVYTLPETIDLINEALADQKYILIQRERSFTLVPTDDRIDIAPRIPVEDLDKRGNTEIVSIILPLKNFRAEEVATDVKRLLSKFGEVAALTAFNKLMIQDTVGNLKQIVSLVISEDRAKGERTPVDTHIHNCKHIQPQAAEKLLKELLGDASNPALHTTEKAKLPRIVIDTATESLILHGPADSVAKGRDILHLLDVDPKRPGSKPVLKEYEVAPEKAVDLMHALQSLVGGPVPAPVFVTLAGNNKIVVLADAKHQEIIARMLPHLASSIGNKSGDRAIVLDKKSAAELANALERMLKEMRKNPVETLPANPPEKPAPRRPRGELKKPEPKDELPEPPTSENLEVVLQASRFELIAYSDYYGAWIASFRCQFVRESTLLCDRPLPRDSRFQKDKQEAQQKKHVPLPEPQLSWKIRNRMGEVLLELHVIRIDPERVLVLTEGEYYSIPIGTFLSDAMVPLKNAEIEKLGLIDREETLRNATLTKLEYQPLRKAYEGLFANPAYKDKSLSWLSTEPLPEEFDAPDSLLVKNRLGIPVLKITVVRMDKDRVVFTVEKKYYSIKLGGNLLDAMKKPLSDAEVKDLKLP
jgi:hypothetical protein